MRAEPAPAEAVPETTPEDTPEESATKAADKSPAGAEEIADPDVTTQKEAKQPAEPTAEKRRKAEQEEAAKREGFLEEKNQIMIEMERATSGFKNAKAAKDKERKDQYWSALQDLQKKLAELRKRVISE